MNPENLMPAKDLAINLDMFDDGLSQMIKHHKMLHDMPQHNRVAIEMLALVNTGFKPKEIYAMLAIAIDRLAHAE